jgi:hypothetical protein
MAEKYGNPTVFLQPTNRKQFPLNGQFGLASSDYMYGIQRPEFSQCRSPRESRQTGLKTSVGIFKQSMGARNRVGIGLSYPPARLHRLTELIL